MSASLGYIQERYTPLAVEGRRVTVYTGEQGTIVGACPQAAHYLHVLVDGDAEPIILHPSWEITYHGSVSGAGYANQDLQRQSQESLENGDET